MQLIHGMQHSLLILAVFAISKYNRRQVSNIIFFQTLQVYNPHHEYNPHFKNEIQLISQFLNVYQCLLCMFQNLVKLRQNVAYDVNYIPINVTFLLLHYHIAILGYIHTGIKELFRIIQKESHTTELVSENLCCLRLMGRYQPSKSR